MVEKLIPEVAVMLDRERHFRVSMGALLRFQEKTGKNPLKQEVMRKIGIDLKDRNLTPELFVLLWASLRHEDEELTIEQVEDMIYPSNFQEVCEKFIEAFKAANPTEDKAGKEKPPLARKPRKPQAG